MTRTKVMFGLLGVVPLVVSCASPPLALAPVGPNPSVIGTSVDSGGLQVFSELVQESDDQNQAGDGASPFWYQHSGYSIYTAEGKLVKRVDNTVGHYATAPRVVALPPGRYTVQARAKGWRAVAVPVEVARGRTTRVHLDENWQPPPGTLKNEVVSAPSGAPVGWRADLPSKF